MDRLTIHLALNGAAILLVSLVGGLLLYTAILKQGRIADWHLVHAGGTARGVLLIALAATLHLPALTSWQVAMVSWFIIFFAWTSTLAMFLRAWTGEQGFEFSGTLINRLIFLLYAFGALTIFPGLALFIYGLLKALLY